MEQVSHHEEFLKKSLRQGYDRLFGDIEIPKSNFRVLLQLFNSISILFLVEIYYGGDLLNSNDTFWGNGAIIGALVGLLLGIIYIDKLFYRFTIISRLLLFSSFLEAIGAITHYFKQGRLSIMFFSLNIIILLYLFVLLLIEFIQYTTIMERGRIMASLIIINAFGIILIGITIIFNKIFTFLWLFFPSLNAYFLYKNRDSEKTFIHYTLSELDDVEKQNVRDDLKKQTTEDEKFHKSIKDFIQFLFNKNSFNLLKYLIILFLISAILGLVLPNAYIEQIFKERGGGEYIIEREILITSPIFLSVGAFFIGMIFDIYGRRQTIALLILFIAIVNFFTISLTYSLVQLGLILALAFSILISVILITGELSRREYYARTLIFSIVSVTLGIFLGLVIKDSIILYMINQYTDVAEEIISETQYFSTITIFMLCVISLYILATTTSSSYETEQKDWQESLQQLWVIHNSGVLIYDHTFSETEDTGAADLASGGLMGLTGLLKEITKGKEKLRIIDHGNKKLLFQWDQDDKIVFVLVIDRELIVLRHKLTQFVRSFYHQFGKYFKHDFLGVNVDRFLEPCDALVDLYFKRKYFKIPVIAEALDIDIDY